MNKKDLIRKISEEINGRVSMKDIQEVLEKTLEEIKKGVAEGDKVQLIGFGTFSAKLRKGRTGRNLRTGEEIVIPDKMVPVFKPGKEFKEDVEG